MQSFWLSDNCDHRFSSQQKYDAHECCIQIKTKILCPYWKQIKFKNNHKQQEVNNVTFSDNKCYMKSVSETIGDKTYKLSTYVPIAIEIGFNAIYESYFCLNVLKIMLKIY